VQVEKELLEEFEVKVAEQTKQKRQQQSKTIKNSFVF
jgi:hypothetical protein